MMVVDVIEDRSEIRSETTFENVFLNGGYRVITGYAPDLEDAIAAFQNCYVVFPERLEQPHQFGNEAR